MWGADSSSSALALYTIDCKKHKKQYKLFQIRFTKVNTKGTKWILIREQRF